MKSRTQPILYLLIIVVMLLGACSPQVETGTTVVESGSSAAAQPLATSSTTQISQDVVADTATAETETVESAAETAVSLDMSYDNAASVPLQLLLGTFKLAEGDLAVTPEQASALLPLWEGFKTISFSSVSPGASDEQSANSDTQAQIDDLTQQIQAVMTSEQLSAIAAMQITQETMMTIMEEQGITMSAPGGMGMPNDMGAPPDGGQPPSDGVPAGADQPPDNGQMTAPPVGDAGPGVGAMVPPEVIDALIQLLANISGEPLSTGSTAAVGSSSSASGVYSQNSGTETQTGQAYTATETDQSAIYVTNGGTLTVSEATIVTSGDTSSQDNSSFYGLNAAVLAESGSTINLSDSTISTTGTGANGAFATGSDSVVNLTNVTIDATADGGHGVMATQGGTMTLTDVDITTAGPHSGAVATDRGSGTISAIGGTVTAAGADSPAIYSTGDITVFGGVYTATGAEAAVIEGANSITLTNTALTSTYADKWGVMIYQSFSGDAEGSEGSFTMTGGSLGYASASGPLFYVNNATGYVALTGVDVTVDSGWLIDASANDRWGTSGANGGTVYLIADTQILVGDITADSISSVTAVLQNNTALTGTINADNTAAAASLTLDASSTWTVTADSYLTCLTNSDGIFGETITNIIGNGYTVYYDAEACPALGGLTYSLSGGGYLQPIN